ncbi:MAG: efflux RND transporter periplasmic adaptor subunit [Pseudophaeobacter sp. bin_em_oilr2.035]|jgi:RND family efflux transporter MFP subunit|uniref:Efflux RND transporter periplasmic adaptor subunit n=1 Tax=Ruegeria aquimaris TaxID=2984333 RepID=A0ABT3ARW6_9RHOB|nr:efflux RND transporter periplasmic adaptor subunit [Ruegeria sp. XHP0148]MCV2891430.1 efflux RND transporter periplasmic adaptor subunit [Ruegeria sp. XHP0148]MDF1774357.1 efflux RND transporter periplasmic adaptor subunit [Pseudophaeobacter sp. bin_em_oilr2.035]
MFNALFRTALVGVCLFALVGCKEDPEGHHAPEARSLDLPVTRVEIAAADRLYSTPGSAISQERIEVSSRTTGYLQRITVHEGDVISKGDILIEIDPTDIEGAINRAQAALSSAETALSDAEQDVVRLENLLERGAVSNENLRKATVARDVSRARLAEAQAALDTALAGRRYTTIISPIDGIVVARQKQVGDLATPGFPILTIESRTRLLFRTSVSESHIGVVRVGDPVKVAIDALGKEDVTGEILRIIPSGDPVTRRYDVEIALPSGLDVFPGMFGRAHFVIGSDRVVTIPARALTERGGLPGAFIVGDNGAVHFRWLRTGRELSDAIEVNAGLNGGETIVAQDDDRLRGGDRIETTAGATPDE